MMRGGGYAMAHRFLRLEMGSMTRKSLPMGSQAVKRWTGSTTGGKGSPEEFVARLQQQHGGGAKSTKGEEAGEEAEPSPMDWRRMEQEELRNEFGADGGKKSPVLQLALFGLGVLAAGAVVVRAFSYLTGEFVKMQSEPLLEEMMYMVFNVSYRRFVDDASVVSYFGQQMRWDNFRFGSSKEGSWLSFQLIGSLTDANHMPRVGTITMEAVPAPSEEHPNSWRLLFYEVDFQNGVKKRIPLDQLVDLDKLAMALQANEERQRTQQLR